jgi:hypothetical protein
MGNENPCSLLEGKGLGKHGGQRLNGQPIGFFGLFLTLQEKGPLREQAPGDEDRNLEFQGEGNGITRPGIQFEGGRVFFQDEGSVVLTVS